MHIKDADLKALLLDSELVSKEDIEEAEEKVASNPKLKFGDALISEGDISEENLRRLEGHILGVPFISLDGIQIDSDILRIIPEPIARKHNVIAYKKNPDRKELEVAMLDTSNLEAIDFIKKKTGLKVLVRLTGKDSIKDALLQYQKSLKDEFGDIIQQEAGNIQVSDGDEGDEAVDEASLKELAEDLPVVRIVETLLNHAVTQGASDIHIEPMEKQVVVRYRIDGILEDAMVLPRTAASGITARIKVLSNLRLDEKRVPQDGRFKITTDHEEVSLRVSTLPVSFGEKTVMRLLRDSVQGYTLESLGFHGKGLEDFHGATKETTGMILVTGPTGSGKSTTLYTALDILNQPDVNISTVEDPVEYQMPRINQSQVKPKLGFDFSSGLRALLRQDPDIIMVGEIRDQETAALAINAALTGHLVLSTLHTNSAAGAVPRLIDMGAESFLIISTLKVVVAQRLVRKLCNKKEKYTLTPEEIKELEAKADLDLILTALKEEQVIKENQTFQDIPFYHPVESAECEDGYSGRQGIYEVLHVTESIKELIKAGESAEVIEKQAKTEGMMSMLEDGIFKAAQGVTTIEEVLRVVSE